MYFALQVWTILLNCVGNSALKGATSENEADYRYFLNSSLCSKVFVSKLHADKTLFLRELNEENIVPNWSMSAIFLLI